jgi:hypothetical protein
MGLLHARSSAARLSSMRRDAVCGMGLELGLLFVMHDSTKSKWSSGKMKRFDLVNKIQFVSWLLVRLPLWLQGLPQDLRTYLLVLELCAAYKVFPIPSCNVHRESGQ